MPPRSKPKEFASRVRASTWDNSLGLEGARQLMHLLVGLGCAAVLAQTSLDIFRTFILGLLFFGVILSIVASSRRVSVVNRILALVERPHEGVPGQGAFFFLVGVGIPAFLFSNAFAVLVGVVALTFQDAFSTLVGKRFGRTSLLGRKSLEGFIGGWVACTIGLSVLLPFPLAVGFSLVVSLVELLPIDDAITLPLVAAYFASVWV